MKDTARELREAASAGKAHKVRALIPSVDKRALDEALVYAVSGNQTEAALVLLKAGANPQQRAAHGSVLSYAAAWGNLEIVKALVEADADVNWMVSRENALMTALENEREDVIAYLESRGAKAPPNASLAAAAKSGDIERAKRALAEGADLEKPSGLFSEPPLTIAAGAGQLNMVKLLLERGANPNKKSEMETPLRAAVLHGKNLDVVKALVAAGAQVNAKVYGETLLMAAASQGLLEIAQWLVEQGVDPNEEDKNCGMTALDHAKPGKTPGHKKVTAWLASLGAQSVREGPRQLVRALAKEYGGKPGEHHRGFDLNSKMAGHVCQFQIEAEGGGPSVFHFRLAAPELRALRDSAIMFCAEKPERGRGKTRELRETGKTLGVRAWLEGDGPISEQFLIKYFAPHKESLRELKLTGAEFLVIGPQAMALRWVGTDLQRLMPRMKIFETLVRAVCLEAQPERRLFEKEWLIKTASKADAARARHSFGGAWPSDVPCPDCGDATNLMATIDLADPQLGKTKLGSRKLPIFLCLTCLEWGPAFYDISNGAVKTLDASGKTIAKSKIEKGEPDVAHEPAVLTEVAKAGRKSKLGGKPGWVQTEETPDCPKCQSQMGFTLQLASDKRMTYADMGLLYVFTCVECEVMATLIQSH